MSRSCLDGRGFLSMKLVAPMPTFLSFVLGLVFLAAGCASVPKHMQVGHGLDPRHVDKQVRFRTVYYFRVFDYCAHLPGDPVASLPRSDALYRFRMTGKANAMTNKIRFESGTLKAYQIDPFGATIGYDKKTGRPKYVPTKECKPCKTPESPKKTNNDSQAAQGGDAQIKPADDNGIAQTKPAGSGSAAQTKPADGNGTAQKEPVGSGSAGERVNEHDTEDQSRDAPDNGECPAGSELRRGFQILGPEGFRTFDQDERLVMAMTVSGEPLLSALKEVSKRYLDAHDGPSPSELLLPITQEQLRVLQAERAVQETESTLGQTPSKPEPNDPSKKTEPAEGETPSESTPEVSAQETEPAERETSTESKRCEAKPEDPVCKLIKKLVAIFSEGSKP
jgi:hypothetical protein